MLATASGQSLALGPGRVSGQGLSRLTLDCTGWGERTGAVGCGLRGEQAGREHPGSQGSELSPGQRVGGEPQTGQHLWHPAHLPVAPLTLIWPHQGLLKPGHQTHLRIRQPGGPLGVRAKTASCATAALHSQPVCVAALHVAVWRCERATPAGLGPWRRKPVRGLALSQEGRGVDA